MSLTPTHMLETIQTVINFLDMELSTENLTPSNEMGRTEHIEQLTQLTEKIKLIKDFTLASTVVKTASPKISTVLSKQLPQETTTVHSSLPPPSTPTNTMESLTSHLKSLLKCSMSEIKQRADMCGYLKKHKKQKTLSKWNQRFCVLCGGVLLYFDSDKETCKNKGFIVVGAYNFTIPQNSNGFTFELESCQNKGIGYTFQADHKKDVEGWKQHLSQASSQGYTKDMLAAIKQMDVSNENADEDVVVQALKVNEVLPATPFSSHPTPPPPVSSVVQQEEFYEVIPAMSSGDVIKTSPQPVPSSQQEEFNITNLFVGIRDCLATADSQDLSFRCGDVMYVLERVDNNWSIAHHVNGSSGLVPQCYLRQAYECMA